ncbi:hypothetical protein A5681_01340 [Mycobacterium scrofulaceum]|nr:hypothetical protein A5681_01340 [Mycobacterium scrofulaceum]
MDAYLVGSILSRNFFSHLIVEFIGELARLLTMRTNDVEMERNVLWARGNVPPQNQEDVEIRIVHSLLLPKIGSIVDLNFV